MKKYLLRLLSLFVFCFAIYNFLLFLTIESDRLQIIKNQNSSVDKVTKKLVVGKNLLPFLDQTISLYPKATFVLEKNKLIISSTHAYESDWGKFIKSLQKHANNKNIYFEIVTCAFSEHSRQLKSECQFLPYHLYQSTK